MVFVPPWPTPAWASVSFYPRVWVGTFPWGGALGRAGILIIPAHGGISGRVQLTQMFSPCSQICGGRVLASQLWSAGRPFFCSSGAFPIWCLLASCPLACWLLLGSVWRRKALGSRFSPCLMSSLPAVSPCAQVPGNYPPAGFCC